MNRVADNATAPGGHSQEFRIRPAVSDEADALTQIAMRAKASWGYGAEQIEAWRPQLTIAPALMEAGHVWVAERQGVPVGVAALIALGRRARLEHLWVVPEAQRMGVGQALFETAFARAVDDGWEILELDSDPNAEGFYQRMGGRLSGSSDATADGHGRALPRFEFDLKLEDTDPEEAPPDILLATLNAKYIHAAFGLRYLHANLGDLQQRARILEFDINQKPIEIAETILALNPRILGLGVYIWNVTPTTELVAILKRARPDLCIVLGGPEVSHETEGQEIVALADHVITGEADLLFPKVCRTLLQASEAGSPGTSEEASARLPKVLHADIPDLSQVVLPYDLYSDADAAHRVVYVEASRGCPFTCEFCLSSLDIPVRQFPLDRFLGAMQRLLDRGVTQFKFVDRTFNLHLPTSRAILKFFLDRWRPGLFIHFEMVPDRLPEGLREWIAKFPPGALQFEVGIQTFNPQVETLISRRQNHKALQDNFRWLRQHSGVHIHADLIAGLPGESLQSFANGFDQLIALDPQEIQVGILKRLRGTPISRHDAAWAMVYSPKPPYDVLQTRLLDFSALARVRRFARYWDLFANSGNFPEARRCLLGFAPESPGQTASVPRCTVSPFWSFWRFATWLHENGFKTSGIALLRQFECVFDFLTNTVGHPEEVIRELLRRDYMHPGRKDLPGWLGPRAASGANAAAGSPALPRRQARHVGDGLPQAPND